MAVMTRRPLPTIRRRLTVGLGSMAAWGLMVAVVVFPTFAASSASAQVVPRLPAPSPTTTITDSLLTAITHIVAPVTDPIVTPVTQTLAPVTDPIVAPVTQGPAPITQTVLPPPPAPPSGSSPAGGPAAPSPTAPPATTPAVAAVSNGDVTGAADAASSSTGSLLAVDRIALGVLTGGTTTARPNNLASSSSRFFAGPPTRRPAGVLLDLSGHSAAERCLAQAALGVGQGECDRQSFSTVGVGVGQPDRSGAGLLAWSGANVAVLLVVALAIGSAGLLALTTRRARQPQT
jgi:hypothetical protein